MRSFWKNIKNNENGVFTLEASILFPIILIMTMLFVFFSLVIFEKVTLQYEANKVANELAYTWNNSLMDVETGAFGKSEYTTYKDNANTDGLYWRLTGNNILSMFTIDDAGGADNSALVDKKINRMSDYDADITFNSGFLIDEIEVTMKKKLSLPTMVTKVFGGNAFSATATETITDPPELIRNTDFVIYGVDKIKEYGKYIFQFKDKE